MNLSIGQVAKQFGVSIHTLRYYEKTGLLPAVPKTSGRRIYNEDLTARLHFIKHAQTMQFSLKEVKQLLTFKQF